MANIDHFLDLHTETLFSHRSSMQPSEQAGASSARLDKIRERRTLPIGQNIGTMAVMVATLLVEGEEWLRLVTKPKPAYTRSSGS